MTVGASHPVDVRSWPALARTRITVVGVLDTEAVEAIDGAIDRAEASAHWLSLDLTQIASITAHALSELMTRGYRPAPVSSRSNAPVLPITVPA